MTDWVLTLLWWSRQMYTLTPLWKTAGSPWRLGESEREMRKNIKRTKGGYRQANSKHYTFTGLINHSCYESSPWNMWHDTLTSLTVPELMYFFFLPFFLGFNTLTIREETWNKLFNKQVRTHYIVFPHISKLIWTGGDLILSSNKGWNS